MADHYPPRSSRDPQAELELTRLERPAGRGGGWRLPAALVAVALVGVVIVGRLGMDGAPPAASPSPTTAAISPTPSDSAAQSPSPVPGEQTGSPRPTLPPSSDAIPQVARYLDGIPTSLAGERIYRVDSALARAGDRLVLVGGWYAAGECEQIDGCIGHLFDSPAAVGRGQGLPVASPVVPTDGPLVLRARVLDDCLKLAEQRAGCGPTLSAVGLAWTGDLVSAATPIEVQPLLHALGDAFTDMRADPFQELSRCPMPWPPQTYRSVTGGPRMMLIFPTIEDRQAAEAQIQLGWPRPPEGTGGQCLDQFMPLAEPAGWLAQDNVMLWLSERDDVRALARAALLDARNRSRPSEAVVPAPITIWAAMRAIQRWEPTIEVLPALDSVVWSPDGLPAGGDLVLSDPYVRLLLVFPDSVARRAYERSVDAGDVIVTSLRPTEPEILRQLEDIRAAGVRWLGERNILLQVNGPPGIDDELRAAIRDVTRGPGR